MTRLNGKVLCSIVLAVGFVILLGYGLVSYASEDVVVNTTTAGGEIVFQDNDSHGVYLLGKASHSPDSAGPPPIFCRMRSPCLCAAARRASSPRRSAETIARSVRASAVS